MDVLMLIIGIALAIAGLICMYLGPRRVTTTTINKVEHEYKTSTDYDRLYDLLMEGRDIIIINGNGKYPSLASVVDGCTSYGKVVKRFYGFGINHPLDDCTKEKFILFCQFNEIKYFDQIDKYLTLQDYMKK
jgi:hypothetical protein